MLAVEWARYNIQVNAIGPGYVETDLTKGMRTSKIISENLLNRTPMHRFAKPEEIVGAAVFLASKETSYVTGPILFRWGINYPEKGLNTSGMDRYRSYKGTKVC